VAQYKRAELEAQIHQLLRPFDAFLVPTATHHPTLDEVAASPLGANARLGEWTNFANLADLCAIALPGVTRRDGLPFGMTLMTLPWEEGRLETVAEIYESASARVEVAVVGAHLTGMPLNHLLTNRGGVLCNSTTTAPHYRLFALEDTTPPKPALVRTKGPSDSAEGFSIAVEVWSLPLAKFGEFVAEIPAPLGIGKIELADGRIVCGFLAEAVSTQGRKDISHTGGWKAWLASR
jgi:allophanate hydrolase